MYLLEELWYGNVNPNERYNRPNSEYAKLIKESADCLKRLEEELTPEASNLLEEFCNIQARAAGISEEDTFIRGVRIGARFILDVVGDYRSQTPQIGADE